MCSWCHSVNNFFLAFRQTHLKTLCSIATCHLPALKKKKTILYPVVQDSLRASEELSSKILFLDTNFARQINCWFPPSRSSIWIISYPYWRRINSHPPSWSTGTIVSDDQLEFSCKIILMAKCQIRRQNLIMHWKN